MLAPTRDTDDGRVFLRSSITHGLSPQEEYRLLSLN